MTRPRVRHPLTLPVLAGVAVAAVWVGLAVWQPTTTWHLAPVLVALAPAWIAAQRGDRWPRWIGIGLACSLAATALLHGLALLRGPALIGGTATVEALLSIAGVALAWLAFAAARAGRGSDRPRDRR